MKIVASLIVKNELGRYLEPCVASLAEFCDEIVMLDDGSDGALNEYLGCFGDAAKKVYLFRDGDDSAFFEHEGRARQRLLDLTLMREPSFVLAIDADEFLSNGALVRHACEQGHDAYGMTMFECWSATDERLCIRVDGGWKPSRVPALWRVPNRSDGLRIADRALACGRVPTSIDRRGAVPIDADILHFGWSNESERVARHHRYAVADGGRFHRSAHLDSILFGCERVELERMGWPAGLLPYRDAILARVTSGVSPAVIE